MDKKITPSTINIESPGKNLYLYDRNLKKTILCHPILFYLAQQKIQGNNLNDMVQSLLDGQDIPEQLKEYSKEEIKYYYQKLRILENQGFFSSLNQESILNNKLSVQDIQTFLANIRQITFEVTDYCNLKCKYCGYGEFYNDYDRRETHTLDFNTAKTLVLYLKDWMDSSLNHSQNQKTYIGFYGGEPLLNFPFIREMVEYIETLTFHHNRIGFSITTNGILLNRYIDFLVKHDFNMYISLDGNEDQNGYRVYANGQPCYQQIVDNIEKIRKDYPEYFQNRVNFNAVLHNKNSVAEIFHFYKKHYKKIPKILSLSTSGIREDRRQEFQQTYVNLEESLYNSEDYSLIEKEMYINLPTIQNINTFLIQINDFCFRDYTELFQTFEQRKKVPTATCLPFTQKMFVTAGGKILPCERIGQQFFLGKVEPDRIDLDFNHIADLYNSWFEKMNRQCTSCYLIDQCSQCFFNLDISKDYPGCRFQLNFQEYSKLLSSFFGYFEKKRSIIHKLLKEVYIE